MTRRIQCWKCINNHLICLSFIDCSHVSDYSIESRQPWYQSEIRLGVHELSILMFQLVCDLCDVHLFQPLQPEFDDEWRHLSKCRVFCRSRRDSVSCFETPSVMYVGSGLSTFILPTKLDSVRRLFGKTVVPDGDILSAIRLY